MYTLTNSRQEKVVEKVVELLLRMGASVSVQSCRALISVDSAEGTRNAQEGLVGAEGSIGMSWGCS